MRLAFGLADHIKQMAHTWVSNIHLAEGLHRTPKWRSLTSLASGLQTVYSGTSHEPGLHNKFYFLCLEYVCSRHCLGLLTTNAENEL